MSNIAPELLRAQDLVVRRFLPKDWSFFQILTRLSHSDSMDLFVGSTAYDTIVLLDVDCIPLNEAALGLLGAAATSDQFVGCAQRANHISNDRHVYAGPFCCALNRQLWTELGSPSFRPTPRGDVGEELTYLCQERGKSVQLWWPTAVEQARWELVDGLYFGIGTEYAGRFWHLFESRAPNNRERFVAKCYETLEASIKRQSA